MSGTTTATIPAEPVDAAEKSALAFDLSFIGVYTKSKELYAEYMPAVAATFIATYAAAILAASPFKISALESLETLDAFLVSFFTKADVKAVEFKEVAVKKVETVRADVDTKVEEVKAKVETVKGQALDLKGKAIDTASAKVNCVKARVEEYKGQALELKGKAIDTAAAKVDEVKVKYEEVKVVAAKKVEQTQVVAQKVKVIATDTAASVKEEITKEGVVVYVTGLSEVAKEQGMAAYEVVKAEGVKTLVTNVTNAVIEKVNEVPVAEAKPSPEVVAAPVTAPAPVAVGPDEQ